MTLFEDEDGDKYVRPEDKPEGAIGPEDLVGVEEAAEEAKTEEDKEENNSLDEVAQQVIAGEWGVGQERRRRLSEAGHDVQEVEARVTKLLND